MLSLKEYVQAIESKERQFRSPELQSKNDVTKLYMEVDILKEMIYELADKLEGRLREHNIT